MKREELIKSARSLYNNPATSPELKKILESEYPELKESEDERIRREIVGFIEQVLKDKNVLLLVADRIGDDIPNMIPGWIAYLEKQKEQKPVEWSEEDDKMLEKCVGYMTKLTPIPDNETFAHFETRKDEECINWLNNRLKFLRPQPKQEWSDENEEHLNSIIESYKVLLKDYKACHDVDYIPYSSNTVIRNVVDDINFLKSLHPQPHWKPREEQMEALYNAQRELCGTEYNEGLYSLIDELQKLL